MKVRSKKAGPAAAQSYQFELRPDNLLRIEVSNSGVRIHFMQRLLGYGFLDWAVELIFLLLAARQLIP